MIRNSFIILDHIGEGTEKKIWSQGISTWEEFLKAGSVKGISAERKPGYDTAIKRAMEALREGRIDHFREILPKKYTWRLLPELWEDAAYLDIETTGLNIYSTITLVGIYTKGKVHSLVHGQNLSSESIKEALSDSKIVVTFNGAMFDLPFIEHHFPGALPDLPHVDLRFAGKQAGLSGGLKKIEVAVGISRPDDLVGVDGYEAVRLWRRWTRQNDDEALDKLIRYNKEDIVNLEELARIIVDRLASK